MTIAEKLEMYKEKRAFVNSISKVFEARPKGSSVSSIDYEVYEKVIARNENVYKHIVEFIVVTYDGGGRAMKVASGNSNTANFRVIGTLLDGGNYEDNQYYESLLDIGYTRIEL